MTTDTWGLDCLGEDGNETFVIVRKNLAEGRMIATYYFDTEEELRAAMADMGVTDDEITDVIRRARRAADQKAATVRRKWMPRSWSEVPTSTWRSALP